MAFHWILYSAFMIIKAYFHYQEGNYMHACVNCVFVGAGIAMFIVELMRLIKNSK